MKMAQEAHNNDTRKQFTAVASSLYKIPMPSTLDIVNAAQSQFDSDVKRLIEVNKKMGRIRDKYLEYKELDAQAKQLDERVRSQIGAFGNILKDADIEKLSLDAGITTTAVEEMKDTPLWKMVREIVRQVTEIRVMELEQVITNFGHPITRQAMESAIKTHAAIFRVMKRVSEV